MDGVSPGYLWGQQGPSADPGSLRDKVGGRGAAVKEEGDERQLSGQLL